jgi:aspartyl protease family protein
MPIKATPWIIGLILTISTVSRLFGHTDHVAAEPVSRAAAMAQATDKALATQIDRAPDGHFYVNALVNDKLVHFLVDTGASSIALTRADAEAAGIAVDPADIDVVARGASGDVRGARVNVHHVAIGQKEAWDLPSVVITDDMDVSLLGQSYLSQIGSVSIVNDKMILE